MRAHAGAASAILTRFHSLSLTRPHFDGWAFLDALSFPDLDALRFSELDALSFLDARSFRLPDAIRLTEAGLRLTAGALRLRIKVNGQGGRGNLNS